MKRDFPEDLGILARRGFLSAVERQALERALSADPLLQIGHRVGSDFDRISAVRAGDDDLIARSVGALPMPTAHAPSGRRARRSLGLLLAAAFMAGGVAAASGGAWYRALTTKPEPSVAPFAIPAPGEAALSRTERASSIASATPSEAVLQPSAPVGARAAPALSAAPTAAGLFEQASAARRDRDYGRATELFAQLQKLFPGSPEAHLAEISLGKLLLTSGQPDRALSHFRNYSSAGAGPLVEEALVGSAECLMRLGRIDEERRSWQELLEKYPTSVHAGRARARLRQIDGATP
jgi:TolA-binding protein